MAYRDGQWQSDRETRKANEDKWKGAGVDLRSTGNPDLDRAIQKDAKKGLGTDPKLLGGGGSGSGTLGPIVQTGHKIDRPTIPGGCSHLGQEIVTVLSTGTRIYAAQGMKLTTQGMSHLDLVLDCAGMVKASRPFVQVGRGKRWAGLNRSVGPDVVKLDWPDMTAPTHVGIRFWMDLVKALPRKVCIACMGAHGRTGTAIAAILVADGMDGDQAIRTVRKEHCPRAIETVEQEQYIRALAQDRARMVPEATCMHGVKHSEPCKACRKAATGKG